MRVTTHYVNQAQVAYTTPTHGRQGKRADNNKEHSAHKRLWKNEARLCSAGRAVKRYVMYRMLSL
jgi:hypothetical protein